MLNLPLEKFFEAAGVNFITSLLLESIDPLADVLVELRLGGIRCQRFVFREAGRGSVSHSGALRHFTRTSRRWI